MLASFRKLANTWPARIFLIILGVSFASWGVADVARRLTGGTDAVASVQGHDITPAAFMTDYQDGLREYAQQLPDPTQIPMNLRMRVAGQTLTKLVTQAALSAQEDRMGITVPDAQLRDAVFAMPEFQGLDGKFDRRVLLQTLASHNLTETRFLELVRGDIRQNQLINTIAANAAAPSILAKLVFKYIDETRTADVLLLPFRGQPLPAPPAQTVLRRYYDNNPEKFSAPEYRRISVVVLSADTIGRGLEIPEADMRAWFNQHKAEYVTQEKRSVQVITTDSDTAATSLAADWRAGAAWDQVQQAAKTLHATTVPLDDATRTQIPSPELAQAAFTAPLNEVIGPIKQALGYYVLKVTAITPARNPSFDSLRDEVRRKVAAERALDVIDARAQKLQDVFAGGAKMNEIPADLGAAGAEGTLDAKGLTPTGEPAPLPAGPDLRKAIIAASFQAKPGESIQPTEGPDHSWYAVSVDSITKPARKPFEQCLDDVLLDWQRDQVRHKQDEEAAKLLTLVKSGQSLANAAWGSGLQVTRTPPLSRNRPQAGLSAELIAQLFTLQPGQATEAETASGFIVAQLAQILPPDPKSDQAGMKQAQDGLTHAMHDDYLQLYAAALRDQAKPVEHPEMVEKLIQQPGE
jgi:peptidyl-prolyl cis-trans isomerase D